jgi:hypothetical protein
VRSISGGTSNMQRGTSARIRSAISLTVRELAALIAGEGRDLIKKLLAEHKPARVMSLSDLEQMVLATRVIAATKVDFLNS